MLVTKVLTCFFRPRTAALFTVAVEPTFFFYIMIFFFHLSPFAFLSLTSGEFLLLIRARLFERNGVLQMVFKDNRLQNLSE